MGLDSVEMVLRIEADFDISLDDAAAASILTPRDLIEAVLAKIQQTPATQCLTQRAFHRVRAGLLRNLPLKRKDVTPSTPLAGLVPKGQHTALAVRLAAELDTGPLPGLVRPLWLCVLLWVLCLAPGAAIALWRPLAMPASIMFFAGAVTAAALGVAAERTTRRFRTEFHPRTPTVGSWARWIVAHKTGWAAAAPAVWTREQVSERVREIVIEQLRCEKSYHLDAQFVRDLGMG